MGTQKRVLLTIILLGAAIITLAIVYIPSTRAAAGISLLNIAEIVDMTADPNRKTLPPFSAIMFFLNNISAESVRANTSLCIGTDCRTVWPSGGGGVGNPFDQSLNTTDDVKFKSVNGTGTGTFAEIHLAANDFTIVENDADYIELTGDGVVEGGLGISIPMTAGNDFYYGYGGAESHRFGRHGEELIIDENGNLITTGTGKFNLLLTGGNIGISTDTNLLQLSNNLLYVAGTVKAGIVRTGGSGIEILDDIGETYYLSLRVGKMGSPLTANRLLKFDVGDTDRIITLSGNPTLSDWFDQPVKGLSTPTFSELTLGPSGHLTTSSGGVWTNTVLRISGFEIGTVGDPDLLYFQDGILTINGVVPTSNVGSGGLATDGNEHVIFDVVRHTITGDDESNEYFYEIWTKALPEDVVSITTTIWVIANDETYPTNLYYSCYPGVWCIETKLTTDEDEELYVTGSGNWLEGDIVTVFVVYEA